MALRLIDTKYYKITNEAENHYGFQYKDGLNELVEPFSEKRGCDTGGLYFTDVKNIFHFATFGCYLREITLPETDGDFKMVAVGTNKWRANKIILGKRFDLYNLTTVMTLVEAGANIHANDDCILRLCAKFGHLDIVRYLVDGVYQCPIKVGGSINEKDEFALRWAARNGHQDTVKYLVEKGSNIHIGDDYSLRWSAANGHLDIVKYLVKQGADLDVNKNYPVRWAARNGHLDTVKYLVKKGANIRADHDYALKWAVTNGHLDMVKYLVQNGADIHVGDDKLLINAAKDGHIAILKCLVENAGLGKLPTPDTHLGNDAILPRAIENNHLDIVQYLVENGADIHANNDEALRVAIDDNHIEIAKYLITKGADIGVSSTNDNSEPDTVVGLAIRHGHVDLIEQYFKRAATNTNYNFGDFQTAIHHDNPEILHCLLKYTTVDNIKLHLAKFANFGPSTVDELRKIIIDEKMDINAALCIAVKLADIDLITRCIEKGADIHISNDLPITIASADDNIDIVIELVKLGASIEADNYAAIRCMLKHGNMHLARVYLLMNMDIN